MRQRERRTCARRPIRLPLQVESSESAAEAGWTIDVSSRGILWEALKPFRAVVGQIVRVRLGPPSERPHAAYEVGLGRVVNVDASDPLRVSLELLDGPCSIFNAPEFVGTSPKVQEIKNLLPEVAGCRLNVLITGETGTGKSLLARLIHGASKVAGEPFVAINCASIPPSLFESELFGHEKGAYTGADRATPGYLRLAGAGTILLDEVSEIPVELQAKLLRAIEDKEFRSVGGSESLPVGARIIATTNADASVMMAAGKLRPDLFYRLCELPIHVPPLKERTSDIPLLAEHFLGNYCHQFRKPYCPLEAEQIEQLCRHTWPGNLRELAALMNRTAVLGKFQAPQLDAAACGAPSDTATVAAPATAVTRLLGKGLKSVKEDLCAEAERNAILNAMKASGQNRTRAAQALKISYRTLLRKIAKYHLADVIPPA